MLSEGRGIIVSLEAKNHMNPIYQTSGFGVIFAIFLNVAFAQPKVQFAPTQNELAMLPEPCRVILKGGSFAAAYPDWHRGLARHHYCFGLNFMNRAGFSLDKSEKKFNLQSAVGEFEYVIVHAPPSSPDLQEVKMRKSMAEQMLRLP